MTPDPAKLRDLAQRYTAAWCSQDAASVAAFYSQNGSLSINGGAPAMGRSAITEVAQGFMTAFPDLRVLMDEANLGPASLLVRRSGQSWPHMRYCLSEGCWARTHRASGGRLRSS